MNRRGLLTALGIAVTSAGCVTPTGGPDDTLSAPGTPTDTETPPSEIPTPSDEFADVTCPEFTDADRTVCYHTVTESDEVVLAAEPELFAPDSDDNTIETLRFPLYNRGEWTVLVNPYDWTIHRRDGSSWSRVASAERTDEMMAPLHIVEPGQSLRWELPEMTHPSPGGDDTYSVDASLEPGTYAFSVSGSYGETNLTETPTGEPPAETAFVALFRLDSPIGGAGETRTARTGTSG